MFIVMIDRYAIGNCFKAGINQVCHVQQSGTNPNGTCYQYQVLNHRINPLDFIPPIKTELEKGGWSVEVQGHGRFTMSKYSQAYLVECREVRIPVSDKHTDSLLELSIISN